MILFYDPALITPSPALFISQPAKIFPSKLAASVPNNILLNLNLCSLA